MKRILLTFLLVVSFAVQTAFAADFSKLIILHTNDTHGFHKKDDSSLGIAAVAQLKKDYEEKGFDVILLDAGDAIQDHNLVNLSKGKTAVEFFNAARYDAAVFGNHEFDYGQDILAKRIQEAKYHYISANIIVDATQRLFTTPSIIIKKNSAKIGIIGLTTPATTTSTSPNNVRGLTFIGGKELYTLTQKEVNRLKKKGCDLIILVGHLGSEKETAPSRAEDILNNVEGIDIFLDGHDHLLKNEIVNGALWAETGSHLKNIGRIIYENGTWVSRPVAYGTYNKEDPTVKKLIEKADEEVKTLLGEVIGISKYTLDATREPGVRTMPMNSGDFCADAYLWQANQAMVLEEKVTIALVNGGGIRKSIKAGEVTRGDFLGMNPYNNQLYVIKITGETLLELLEASTGYTPQANGSFPHVAGMKYQINTKEPYLTAEPYPGSTILAPKEPGRRVKITTIANKKFDKKEVYTAVVTSFILSGGGSFGVLTKEGAVIDAKNIGYTDNEALVNYVKSALNGEIGEKYSKAEGRIEIK